MNKNIELLDISHTHITNLELSYICKVLVNLKNLKISFCHKLEEGLGKQLVLTQMESLHMIAVNFSLKDIEHLSKLKLKNLIIGNSGFIDENTNFYYMVQKIKV